ncbi:hypothetical protein IYY11_00310 [Methylocystis sp. H62]|uniref:hypothetical protein n=1 Tax=Methylocystis sp. H62 TaxID=2785789 RepID=UPI0018C2A5A2|nr:hypothetical protein [Methylocystis sp. H62]MBG0791957.1 hypothetical protein [Methylocystis sp. H62]
MKTFTLVCATLMLGASVAVAKDAKAPNSADKRTAATAMSDADLDKVVAGGNAWGTTGDARGLHHGLNKNGVGHGYGVCGSTGCIQF